MRKTSEITVKDNASITQILYDLKLFFFKLCRSHACCLRFLLITALLVLAAFIRLHGVTSNGIRGSDTFQYWDIAILWSHGNLVLNNDPHEWTQYFRPVFYLLNLIALKIFGLHDYALKSLIAIFDVLNIWLLYIIGKLLWRSFILSFLLAGLYAFLPTAVLLSQQELAHVYSTTFVLLMFIFFLNALDKDDHKAENFPKLFYAVSGFFLGCAALAHGSVCFFGASICGAIIIKQKIVTRHLSNKEVIKLGCERALWFIIGCFSIYLIFFLIIGPFESIRAIFTEAVIRDSGSNLGRFSLFWTLVTTGLQETTTALCMYMFWLSVLITLVFSFKNKFVYERQWLPLFIFFSNLFLFAMFFKNIFYTRLLLPQLPFMFMTIVGAPYYLFSFLFRIRVLYYPFSMMFLAYIGYVNFSDPGQLHAILRYFHGKYVSAPREVYNVVGKKVDKNNKLAILPSIYYVGRRQFNAAVYFGGNATYLYDCYHAGFEKYLVRNKIHYVFLSKKAYWDPRLIQSKDPRNYHIGSCFRQNASNYNPNLELSAARNVLSYMHAKQIWNNKKYGSIWYVNYGGGHV